MWPEGTQPRASEARKTVHKINKQQRAKAGAEQRSTEAEDEEWEL